MMEDVDLRPGSSYASEIRPQLPAEAFRPVPSRLAWLAVHLAVIAGGLCALRCTPWWAAPILSLIIGHSFAGCAFVAHETLHGAVVRHRSLRHAVGWLSFLPFTLSPTLWVAWHNKTHHAHTMDPARDPDAYPTMAGYRGSRGARVADRFSFALGRPFGWITLALGLSGQTLYMFLNWTRPNEALDGRGRVNMWLETLAGFAVWTVVAWWLGLWGFLFGYVLPLLVGNFVVICYILTNHSLSPLTTVNDPLVNSLSVTVPGWLARVHLHFGLHVEHHLFPSMSSAHAPLVRELLRARWPERYQSLPVLEALARLARTPRIYASATILEDPLSGVRARTIVPDPLADLAAD
jgi:fatty acid desaturase